MKAKAFLSYGPSLLVVAVFFAVWELAVRLGHITSNILPAPSLIASYSAPYWEVILKHAWQTLLEAVIGLIIATSLGIVTALVLDLSPTIRKAIYPLLVSSQTIPIIALAPLLLVWLGFGLLPKVIIVTLYCFFPIAIAMASGLASVNRHQINLFRTMRASRWHLLRFVSIPTALPHSSPASRSLSPTPWPAPSLASTLAPPQGLASLSRHRPTPTPSRWFSPLSLSPLLSACCYSLSSA